MTIPKVRDFFGIKYVIPYNLTTRKPLLVLRVIGELSYEPNVDQVDLVGGHTEAAFEVEFGQPAPELSGTFREYPTEFYQILETTTVTENSAESDGGNGTDLYINGLEDSFLDIEGKGVSGIDCSSPGTIDLDDQGVVITVVGTAAFTIGYTACVEI